MSSKPITLPPMQPPMQETGAVDGHHNSAPHVRDYTDRRDNAYNVFIGRWEGLCKTYSTKGEFLESAAVHMDVYWVNETTWHLHEHFENLYGIGETVYHTDIVVDGKFCRAESEQVAIEGVQLTPYNYVFTIDSRVTNTLVYNNHYFLDHNTRRIITHKVRGGKSHIFQIQDFTRVV